MKKQDSILVMAAVGLLIYCVSLSFLGQVLSAVQTNKTLTNQGSVTAIGVGVYWNSNGTNPVSSFDWGMLDPGTNKTITCYIKNEGNNVVTLSMSASNWNPANAPTYLTLTWNLGGSTVNPGQIRTARFTLAVSASTSGITNFSFDITIVGSG
jgi:hypothetical protein